MAFALFRVRKPVDFSGDMATRRVIVLIILVPLVSQMPDLQNADYIFFSINALSQDRLNIGQNKPFNIIMYPIKSFINSLSSQE